MKWIGPVPSPHNQVNPEGRLVIDTEYQPFAPEQDLQLDGEETCLVRLSFDNLPLPSGQQTEDIYFSTRTVVEVQPDREEAFTIKLPADAGKSDGALLGLGLFRNGGFAVNPCIRVNGRTVTGFDLTWTQGISMYHALEELSVPAEFLRAGDNEVTLSFPAGNSASQIIVSSLRLRILKRAATENHPPVRVP